MCRCGNVSAMKSAKLSRKSLFPAFYFISGLVMVVISIVSGETLLHIALLGFLNMVTSYGLSRTERWTLYLVVIVFFTGVTLGLSTLYVTIKLFAPSPTVLSIQAAAILYSALLVASFVDTLLNRKKFE